MMKQFLTIGLLIIGISIVSVQTTEAVAVAKADCKLKLAMAPEINRLKLGMTVEQVLARFPGSSAETAIRSELAKAPGKFGVANILITPDNYRTKSEFAGILHFSFKFLDGRLYTLIASYNGPEWKHVDEFVSKFAREKRLSAADAWQPYVGLDTQLKTLTCNGFEISIFVGGKGGNLNYVKMHDKVAQQKLKEREEKAEQNAAP
jgi:hypothetical protein